MQQVLNSRVSVRRQHLGDHWLYVDHTVCRRIYRHGLRFPADRGDASGAGALVSGGVFRHTTDRGTYRLSEGCGQFRRFAGTLDAAGGRCGRQGIRNLWHHPFHSALLRYLRVGAQKRVQPSQKEKFKNIIKFSLQFMKRCCIIISFSTVRKSKGDVNG